MIGSCRIYFQRHNIVTKNDILIMEVYIMTLDKIKGIIAEQLGVDEEDVKMETHLMKDLEADSLDAVEIIMAIEDEFDIEVPDEDAEKFQTVSDIVNYVESRA